MAGNDGRWFDSLVAQVPFKEMEDRLSLFGQFVGDWEIVEDRFHQKDGTELKFRGELHWGWIVDGRATQDVWMMYSEEERRVVPIGTTIRFYDPGIDAWHSIWIVPERNAIRSFIGRKSGDEVLLEAKTDDGRPERWVFFDIGKNEFKWRAEESNDGGESWELTEEMLIRRMTGP